MGKKVFVSHSHKDNDIVVTFVKDLLSVGLDVWVDLVGISSGNFMDRINAALRESEWFVLMVTPHSLASDPVRMEVGAALNMAFSRELRAVIPFVGKPFDLITMEPLWRPLHRYDAVEHGYTSAFRGLLNALGKPAVTPLSIQTLGHDIQGIPLATPQDIQKFQSENTLLRQVEAEALRPHPPAAPPAAAPKASPSSDAEIRDQLNLLFES